MSKSKPTQLARRTIPPEVLAHFEKTTPWAYSILTNPSYIPVLTTAHHFSPNDPDHCPIYRRTLNTPDTIRHLEVVYIPAAHRSPTTPGYSPLYGEVQTIFELGPGVNGYPHHAHGGFLAVLFDELLGSAAACEREGLSFTANLSVGFRKRVRTERAVLGRAWVVREEGRKCWVDGTLEDGEGGVFATATSLWIDIPKGML